MLFDWVCSRLIAFELDLTFVNKLKQRDPLPGSAPVLINIKPTSSDEKGGEDSTQSSVSFVVCVAGLCLCCFSRCVAEIICPFALLQSEPKKRTELEDSIFALNAPELDSIDRKSPVNVLLEIGAKMKTRYASVNINTIEDLAKSTEEQRQKIITDGIAATDVAKVCLSVYV